MNNDFNYFEQLFEDVSDSVLVYDLMGRCLYVNEVACKSRGYTRTELMEMNLPDLEAPEYAGLIEFRIKELLTKKVSTFESAHLCKDKTLLPVVIHARLVDFGDQKVLINVVREMVKPEQSGCQSEIEERYRAIFDRSFDLVYIHDLEGNFIEANDTAMRVLGYSRAEVRSFKFTSLLAPDQIGKAAERLNEMKIGRIQDDVIEYQIKCKNGQYIYVETRAGLLYHQGKPYAIQGIARDITERKHMLDQITGERNKLQSIINSLDCGLAIINPDFNIVYENSFLINYVGNCLGRKCYESFEFKPRICDGCPVKLCLEDGKTHTSEQKVLMPNGETIIWDNTASPIRDSNGRITSILELTRDVTEKIQTEEDFKRLQIQQQSLLDNIPDLAWIKDTKSRFIAVNESMARSSNVSVQAMIGKSDLDYYPPEIAGKYMADDARVIMTGKKITVEEPFVGADRKQIWLETVKTPLCNENGKIIGTTGIARDITRRKEIELKLRESERRFRELADLLPVIAFETDLKGIITYVNNLAVKLFGYTREEFIGRFIFDFVAPEDRARSISNTRRVMAGEYLGNNEYTTTRKDGSRFAALIQTASMKNERGELLGIRGVLVDISNQKKIEDDLRESELKFRTLFEQSQDGIILLNSSGIVIGWNSAHERITGIPREEMLGNYIWERAEGLEFINHKAILSRQIFDDELRKLLKTRKSPLLNRIDEIELRTKDGAVHTCLSTLVLFEMGKEFMVGLILKDITEIDNIRKAMRESEEKYRSLVENIKLGIYRTTPEGRFLEANKALAEITGYTRNELMTLLAKNLYSNPEDRALFVRQLNIASGKSNFETGFIKKDGTPIEVSLSAKAIKDKNGRILYLDGTLEDITERRKIERALQESEEKYHSLVENIKLGIFRTDPWANGRMLEVNKAMEEITGYSREELLKLDVVKLYPTPEGRNEFIRQLSLTPEKATLTNMLCRKDGTQIGASMIAKAIKDKAGHVLYVDGTIEDITERKKMEERIVELYQQEKTQRQELQAEARARGMFIDVLAHELRTPLTPILVSIGILNEMLVPEGGIRGKLAANVYSAAKILSNRLEELLEVARYSRGTFKLEKQPVNIYKYLNEVVSRFKPSLDQRGQTLGIEIAEDLPEAEIDPSRLEQVIINLLSNASKFSPQNGHIAFKAGRQRDDLLVEVQDEGIGITPDESQRIFQPYHRVEQDRLKFPGLGLGLAVAKQIVEAHGGQIWVISQLNQGSIFCFSIPVNLKEPQE